jgi:hypothetical protein
MSAQMFACLDGLIIYAEKNLVKVAVVALQEKILTFVSE